MNKKEISKCIIYTKLESNVTKEDVANMCDEATNNGYYSICVNPKYVDFAKECLEDLNSKVKLTTPIGYPLGETSQEIKAMEAVMAKESGVNELEVVPSMSAILVANYEYVYEEIKRIVDCTEIPVKVILETSMLTDEQILRTCEVCIDAGVKIIKTNTILSKNNASMECVKLISDAVAGICEVNAGNHIQDIDTFYDIMSAGATKVSTDNPSDILKSFDKK